MTTGGESKHPDASGINAPNRGVLAEERKGALTVEAGAQMCGLVFGGGNAIFEHGRRDADLVEPLGDLRAFVLRSEDVVTASGADENRRAVAFGDRRVIDGNFRSADVPQPDNVRMLAWFERQFSFGLVRGQAQGREAGPQFQGGGLCGPSAWSAPGQRDEEQDNWTKKPPVGVVWVGEPTSAHDFEVSIAAFLGLPALALAFLRRMEA